SSVLLLYCDTSRPSPSPKKLASKRIAVSLDLSGRRLGLPVPPTTIPATSVPLTVTVCALKNVIASRKFGFCPDLPFAARSRSELKKFVFGKNGSSLTTHDSVTEG